MRSSVILRLLAWGLALTLVALPLIGVLEGWFAVERWPVRYVHLEAEFSHVSAEQLRAAAARHLGAGFFAVSLDEVREAVQALPWVQSAEVRKRWPDTVEIRVLEQQPIAHWSDDRLVGRDHRLFTVQGAGQFEGLPQLSGPDDRLHEVLAFYTTSQQDFSGTGLNVAAVDLSERGGWRLTLNSGATVEIGRESARARLQRFTATYRRLVAGQRSALAYADLRYSNGYALRWQVPEGAPPAAPPAPKKPQTTAPARVAEEARA